MTLSWHGEGLGDNFGCRSKEESSVGVGCGECQRVVEDGVSMVGEAATATEYCTVEATSSAIRDVQASSRNMELVIKNLERELEEAQVAYAALYLELEKERSAAATAADEAMAMILRLQSEKAAVQMESRQYQRMIEEKSAYDDEEMEILKEIIVRREREKHVLEKEVEAYRQMMLSGEITGEEPESLFGSSDDPTLMLKTISESIKKKEKATSKMKWTDGATGIHFPDLSDPGEEYNVEFQEKGMLTVEVYPSGHCQRSSFGEDAIRYKLDEPKELGFCNEPSSLSGEENAESEHNKNIGIHVNELDREDQDGDQRGSTSSQFEIESSILDVHVIEDKQNLCVEEIGKTRDTLKVVCASEIFGEVGVTEELGGTSNVDISVNKTPISNWFGVEQDIRRSCSDMPKKGELLDTLSDNASHFDLRRSSMSAVDCERLKLETEVEILRKRLKTIQQGRENLNFAVEYRENESFQLQLLEEIACHLQEIRKITEPGKSIRQASLPPLSSKVNSKKRRCRSVSRGLHESA